MALWRRLPADPIVPARQGAPARADVSLAGLAPPGPLRPGLVARRVRAEPARPVPDGGVRDLSIGPGAPGRAGQVGRVPVRLDRSGHHEYNQVRRERVRRDRREVGLFLRGEHDLEKLHRAARVDLLDGVRPGGVSGAVPEQVCAGLVGQGRE